jgi:hypothetical protein
MKEVTKVMLQSVTSRNMSVEGDDFVFVPSAGSGQKCLRSWLDNHRGSMSLSEAVSCCAERAYGLVRVAGQNGRAFLDRPSRLGASTGLDGTSTSVFADPELATTPLPKRRNFSSPQVDGANTARESYPRSICNMDNMPACSAIIAALLQSILHEIDLVFLIQEMRGVSGVLSALNIRNSGLFRQAITAPSAGQGDYNRLEFLGDTMLKFCTELQLMTQHPTLSKRTPAAGKIAL